MSNAKATNAVVPKTIDTAYYLKASKGGFPINGQVPRTYQVYTGTGNQSINYDGSNEIRIFGGTLVGPLIINFGPLRNIRNAIGRLVTLNIIGPISQNITLNSSPAFMLLAGTQLQQLSHVIPGDNVSKSITIYFHSEQYIHVDYGASASSSLIGNSTPKVANLSSTYVYGTDTVFSLPSVFIPDNKSYGVTFNSLEPTTEGVVTPFVGSVSGPGLQVVAFEVQPAPRLNKSLNISGYLDNGGNYEVSFSHLVYPNLSNVHDHEYITGSDTSGLIAMYDPLVNFGGFPKTNDAFGNQVNFPSDIGAFCVDVADSLVFWVENTSNTVIRWRSYTTYTEGILTDMSTHTFGLWNTGDTIVDLAFDDEHPAVLVLPSNPTAGKIVNIPIRPYKNSDPNTVLTGVLHGATFNLGIGTVLHGFDVCPISRMIYVACKPSLLNNSVFRMKPFPDLSAQFSYQHPSIAVDRQAICCSSQGTLYVLYERTLDLVRVNNARTLSTLPADTTVMYTLSQYHQSLSRNCYGWTQA